MSVKHIEDTDDMSYKTMAKKILLFVWPIMLANILQISFNFADTLVVGNFVSEKGLAAVGSAAPLIIFFTWGLNGLSLGADVLISRMIGAGKRERIPNAVFTAIFIAAVFGSLIACLGFVFAESLLTLLKTPEDILAYSTLYTRIYFLACPAISVYHFGSSVLRASGNTKDPTFFLAISGAVNVLLNLVFVAVLHLGITGAASATVLSQFLSAFLIFRRLKNDEGIIRLNIDRKLLDRELMVTMLRYGIPSALQNQLFSFSNIMIQSSINSFGSAFVAANTAANAIEEYVYVFVDAFPLASLTFSSRYYGAKEYQKILRMTITAFCICGIGAFCIGSFILLNGRFLLGLLSNDTQIVEMGILRLRYVTFFLFMNGLLDVTVNSIRGMGLVSIPTIVTLFGVCGFRLLYIYTFFRLHHKPEVLYCCFPLSWLLTLIIQLPIWVRRYNSIRTDKN